MVSGWSRVRQLQRSGPDIAFLLGWVSCTIVGDEEENNWPLSIMERYKLSQTRSAEREVPNANRASPGVFWE